MNSISKGPFETNSVQVSTRAPERNSALYGTLWDSRTRSARCS
jgi:hypothetical protein